MNDELKTLALSATPATPTAMALATASGSTVGEIQWLALRQAANAKRQIAEIQAEDGYVAASAVMQHFKKLLQPSKDELADAQYILGKRKQASASARASRCVTLNGLPKLIGG